MLEFAKSGLVIAKVASQVFRHQNLSKKLSLGWEPSIRMKMLTMTRQRSSSPLSDARAPILSQAKPPHAFLFLCLGTNKYDNTGKGQMKTRQELPQCQDESTILSGGFTKVLALHRIKTNIGVTIFLSDTGEPGVQSMGPGVTNSLMFCRLYWWSQRQSNVAKFAINNSSY